MILCGLILGYATHMFSRAVYPLIPLPGPSPRWGEETIRQLRF
ncbi:hypothetical protein HNO93_001098 [Agrobacterium vitis]|nr:hypothetical protein [Agrobacterium vitis]